MYDKCEAGVAYPGEAQDQDSRITVRGLDLPDRAEERIGYIAELYAAHQRTLRSFLSRFLRNEDDIADTVQDVFIRIALIADPSKVDLNPRAYLFRIAENLVVDRVRRNKSHQADKHDSIDDVEIETSTPSVDDQVHWRRALGDFAIRLNSESPRVAHVVELSCLHDLTHQEIAKQLGVTTRTIERCMQRARHVYDAYIAA
jgi:RNA polymerase sigma factor (sigma-70 family)